jgi:hypothetical protein
MRLWDMKNVDSVLLSTIIQFKMMNIKNIIKKLIIGHF